ncbi:MAG TPA: hypothetical protein DCK95_11770 [Anaerolineaceae bacterium]|jgi:O-antigen/teichoic acid export membrane protein|nr:hypothetical protein [Anaerolineaceae bacterium]
MLSFFQIFNNPKKQIQKLFTAESRKGQFFRGGFGSILITIGNKIIVLITGVLLVRILGKVEYGVYSYVLSLIYVLIIPIESGLTNLIIRETAKGTINDRPDLISGIWRWSFCITIIICSILIIIAAFGMFWSIERFDNLDKSSFFWTIIIILSQSILLLASSALRGLNKITLGQFPDLIILPGIFIIFFSLFFLFVPSMLNANISLALRAASTIVASVFSIVFISKKTPKAVRETKPTYQKKIWTSSAIPLGLSNGLGMVKTRISILLMAFFVTADQIGTFQVAVSTAALASLILNAVDAAVAPQFASLYIQGRQRTLQKLVLNSTRIVFIFNVFVTVIFIIFGKILLEFVFGVELVEAYSTILIIMAGQMVNSFFGSVPTLLNMTGHEKDVMKVIGFSSLINIIITLLLTPRFGIMGGAISTASSLAFAQLIMTVIVNKRLGIVSHAIGRIHTRNN